MWPLSYLAPFRSYSTFYVLLTPPLFNPNFGGVPVAPDRPCWASTSAWAYAIRPWHYFGRIPTSWYLNVTDGQTDGRTDDLLSHHRALRYSIAWQNRRRQNKAALLSSRKVLVVEYPRGLTYKYGTCPRCQAGGSELAPGGVSGVGGSWPDRSAVLCYRITES